MYAEFAQAVEDTAKEVMGNIHTALPAEIIAYANGRVDAKPVGKFYQNGTPLEYPVITGCPIFVTGTVDAEIAAPIKVGDFCMLLISEQSLSEWLTGTQTHNNEQWQLTNAVALCGLRKVSSTAQDAANAGNCVYVAGRLTVASKCVVEGVDVKAKLDNHEARIQALEAALAAL